MAAEKPAHRDRSLKFASSDVLEKWPRELAEEERVFVATKLWLLHTATIRSLF
jgi:hypothetical protein